MLEFLTQVNELNPETIKLLGTIITAGTTIFTVVLTAVIGRFLASFWLTRRDKQDKEAEWRTHAIEITKLDIQRKLATRNPDSTVPMRVCINDFLAVYRDLKELDHESPASLYEKIEGRTKKRPEDTEINSIYVISTNVEVEDFSLERFVRSLEEFEESNTKLLRREPPRAGLAQQLELRHGVSRQSTMHTNGYLAIVSAIELNRLTAYDFEVSANGATIMSKFNQNLYLHENYAELRVDKSRTRHLFPNVLLQVTGTVPALNFAKLH